MLLSLHPAKKKKNRMLGTVSRTYNWFSNCEDKKDVNSVVRTKKSPVGVEPMTFPIPVKCSNHKATLHLKSKKNLCPGCRMKTASSMHMVLAS